MYDVVFLHTEPKTGRIDAKTAIHVDSHHFLADVEELSVNPHSTSVQGSSPTLYPSMLCNHSFT